MLFDPDNTIYFRLGGFPINATIVNSLLVTAFLTLGSLLMSRRLKHSGSISRWQHVLELAVVTIRKQVRDISTQNPEPYLAFAGTLFLFIIFSNLLVVVPGFQPPTASLSTTAALATCVFFAVPFFGISKQGLRNYLRQYLQPTVIMLPFNVIGELSRTLALAVRLYGNMMSGTVLAAILVGFVPLFVPVLINLLGLLTGIIQAYIFAVLAVVYIASATAAHARKATLPGNTSEEPGNTLTISNSVESIDSAE